MGLFSLIGSSLRAVFGTPRSYSTGDQFERYCRRFIFPQSRYVLLQKTHAYRGSKKNYIPSSDPDFKFRDRRSGKIFYVEAKYRSGFFKGQLNWCTDYQLHCYQQRNRERPVFILIGVGGSPAHPSFIALLPLRNTHFTSVFASHAEKYSISLGSPVASKVLWRR